MSDREDAIQRIQVALVRGMNAGQVDEMGLTDAEIVRMYAGTAGPLAEALYAACEQIVAEAMGSEC